MNCSLWLLCEHCDNHRFGYPRLLEWGSSHFEIVRGGPETLVNTSSQVLFPDDSPLNGMHELCQKMTPAVSGSAQIWFRWTAEDFSLSQRFARGRGARRAEGPGEVLGCGDGEIDFWDHSFDKTQGFVKKHGEKKIATLCIQREVYINISDTISINILFFGWYSTHVWFTIQSWYDGSLWVKWLQSVSEGWGSPMSGFSTLVYFLDFPNDSLRKWYWEFGLLYCVLLFIILSNFGTLKPS